MKHNDNDQKGSAHVVLVIVLVLALFTALGWIFWQNFIYKEPVKKDTDLVIVDKKEQEQEPSSDYDLVIKEWGVGADYNEATDTLRYRIEGSKVTLAGEKVLALELKDCGYGSAGSVMRYSATDEVMAADGQSSLGQAKNVFSASNKTSWKQIGDFYYAYSGPQSLCPNGNADVQAQQAATNLARGIVENLEVIR